MYHHEQLARFGHTNSEEPILMVRVRFVTQSNQQRIVKDGGGFLKAHTVPRDISPRLIEVPLKPVAPSVRQSLLVVF